MICPHGQVSLERITEMSPFYGFVGTMAMDLPIDAVKLEFRIMKLVLDATEALPNEVALAVKCIRSPAQTRDSVYRLLPSFEGLSQGKKLLELATDAATARAGKYKHLSMVGDIDDIFKSLGDLEKIYTNDGLEKMLAVKSKFKDLEQYMTSEQDRATMKTFMDTFCKMCEKMVREHVAIEVVNWAECAHSALVGTGKLPSLPGFLIMKLRPLADDVGVLRLLFEFYDETAKVCKMTVDMGSTSPGAGAVCMLIAAWQEKTAGVSKNLALLEAPLCRISTSLQISAEQYYSVSLQQALDAGASALCHVMESTGDDSKRPGIAGEVCTTCLAKCDEAALIVTGFQDPERRRSANMAVNTVRHLVASVFHAGLDEAVKSTVELTKLSHQLGAMQESSTILDLPVEWNHENVSTAAAEVYKTVFVGSGSSAADKVSLEAFKLFCVAWLSPIIFLCIML